MTASVLEALVGGEPAEDVVVAALTTIPASELPGALLDLARTHGLAALPVLTRCLAGRPEWAMAAAGALARVAAPRAAAALQAAEARASSKAVRTAVRRALYRLRQAGIAPPAAALAPAGAPAAPRLRPAEAWMSAVDGTGARGVWLVMEGPLGARRLLSAIVSDEVGLVDAASGPITRKALAERRRMLAEESPLPWVAVPPGWAWAALIDARQRREATGHPVPTAAARELDALGAPGPAGPPPIFTQIPPSEAIDPTLLEGSAALFGLPELGGWFFDPTAVQSDALDLLQARESRLVLSDQLKAERLQALVDRVSDAQFDGDARRRWANRLLEQAFVLHQTGRPAEARVAATVAQALVDPARPARHLPFVRALVERSLEVAGEVALGRVSAEAVRRGPRSR